MATVGAVELGPPPECRLCIAIDFGTSGTGFAYGLIQPSSHLSSSDDAEPRPQDVLSPNQWPEQLTAGKTRTCILLDEQLDTIAFGEEAHCLYNTADTEQRAVWRLHRRFKMALYGISDSLDRDIRALNGQDTPASVVFSRALEAVAHYALQVVNSARAHDPFEKREVYWVLTVPAIWEQGAKTFMEHAAIDAGMSDGDLSRVQLAREPEAASIHCRAVYGANKTHFPVGTRWAVMDCGAGTIDSVVHELTAGGVKEVNQPASGNSEGSTALNGRFLLLLTELVTLPTMQAYRTAHADDYIRITEEVDKAKRLIRFPPPRMKPNDWRSPLTLPSSLHDFVREQGTDMAALVAAFNAQVAGQFPNAISLDGHNLRISFPCAYDRVYRESLEWISAHMRELIESTPNIRYVFLVGNYAHSEVLYATLVELAKQLHVTLIRPDQAGLSIVIGAVLLGLRPRLIEERVAPHSYGIGTFALYTQQHEADGRPPVWQGGEKRTEVFFPFISQGQMLPAGCSVEHTFYPVNDRQTVVKVNVYESDTSHTPYTDSVTCRKCSELSLDMGVGSAAFGGADHRPITVSMVFGDSTIRASARDPARGVDCHVTLEFVQQGVRV